MDLLDALRVLRRRWYVIVAGSMLMLVAAAVTIFVVPTNHQASGQLILLLPAQGAVGQPARNPYLNLDPGLTVAASLIASTVTTKETARNLVARGYPAEYSVALTPGAGPVLEIATKDTDPVAALATRDEVIRLLEDELLRIQTEVQVPNRQLIKAQPNSVTAVAEVLPGSKIRALAVIAVLGGTITLVIAFMFDRQRLQRDQNRSSQQELGDEVAEENGLDGTPSWGDDAEFPSDDVAVGTYPNGITQAQPNSGRGPDEDATKRDTSAVSVASRRGRRRDRSKGTPDLSWDTAPRTSQPSQP